MEKKLQDYIQYYIGCRCLNTWFQEGHEMYNNAWILIGYSQDVPNPYGLENETEATWVDSIKPILRKIDNMTGEQAIALASLVVHIDEFQQVVTSRNKFGDLIVKWSGYSYNATSERVWSADQFNYLLKEGFDLFGLIESGLAINASTLTKKR